MKTPNYKTLFLVTLAMLIGCAVGAISRPIVTAAQTDPARSVYRECAAMTLHLTHGHSVANGTQPESLAIPAGWHVVAGGAGGTRQTPVAIICR